MQGTDCFCNWKAPRWCSLPLIKFLLLIILMMVNHSKETGCLQIHYAGNSGGGAVGESPDNEAAQRASPSPLPMQALLLTLWHILNEKKMLRCSSIKKESRKKVNGQKWKKSSISQIANVWGRHITWMPLWRPGGYNGQDRLFGQSEIFSWTQLFVQLQDIHNRKKEPTFQLNISCSVLLAHILGGDRPWQEPFLHTFWYVTRYVCDNFEKWRSYLVLWAPLYWEGPPEEIMSPRNK